MRPREPGPLAGRNGRQARRLDAHRFPRCPDPLLDRGDFGEEAFGWVSVAKLGDHEPVREADDLARVEQHAQLRRLGHAADALIAVASAQ